MKIIHVTQYHKVPFGITPTLEAIEGVVKSQLMVAKIIKEHPTCPILVEGLSEDISNAVFPPARMIFPNGFPEDFNKVTSLQKDFLYEYGAALTLLYLGEIHSLNKSIHKDASQVLDKEIEEKQYRKIFSFREKEAMECSKEAAISNFGTLDDATIILVYGNKHDFKPYCDKEGFDHEIIQTTHLANTDHAEDDETPYCKVSENKEADSQLNYLNKKLEEYPKNVNFRFERAKIYMSQCEYSKALEDYKFIHDEYPKNQHAEQGIEECTRYLSDQKSSIKKTYIANTNEIIPTTHLEELDLANTDHAEDAEDAEDEEDEEDDETLYCEVSEHKDADSQLNFLNKKLEEYPKHVDFRFERAEIYMSQCEYSKALEDYKFIHDEYPKIKDAARGVEKCTRYLSGQKSSIKKTHSIFSDSLSTSKENLKKDEKEEGTPNLSKPFSNVNDSASIKNDNSTPPTTPGRRQGK